MKIIIAGNGKMGAALTSQLTAEGDDLTLIDSNLNVLESSEESYDIMVVHGNCASMDVLIQAGVKEADLLIAMAGADEVNLLCCMTAHGLNPNIHTIARVCNPEYTDQIYVMRQMFGLSMAVNPERQAATEIERLLKYPGFLKRDTFTKGRVEIVELRIDKKSKLCNVALNDLDGIVKCKILVCAVLRDGKAVAPGGNFVLREGDRIYVTAFTNILTLLLKNLGILTHKVKRVMICGGGRISYYLAKQLQNSGVQVQIIEKDQERCRQLSAILPSACIIQGDSTNQLLLESEGVSSCDALATMTGLDELNMIISLYGNSCGVPQVITKLGHIENADILGDLSLGSVISPKELCCNTIVQYVRAMKNQAGAALTVHTIADGQAEAMEFYADERTRNCGKPLKALKLKKGVLVVCILKGAKMEIPNGDSYFNVGDIVYVVTGKQKSIYQLNDIFE
ncbi:Trk system potassium transporter TrkA [uncultured Acetatifactor sp.]|jgi:trk system potassium uptake protein TrkA|uniref:Trk system potassium transporter TrkA n=1 Tax=uncultured Acetatifactor sp. TaxID=1671927 RepID=UPI002621EE61|nr:Trk system potassium transporter TrkA [uncultured Acetatifactor sp.]